MQPELPPDLQPLYAPSTGSPKSDKRYVVIALITSNAFALLITFIFEFLSLRGVVDISASRVVLGCAWITGLVILTAIVFGKGIRAKWRTLIGGTVSLTAVLWGLDLWAPKPEITVDPSHLLLESSEPKEVYSLTIKSKVDFTAYSVQVKLKLSQSSSADFSFDTPSPRPILEGSALTDIQGLRCTDQNKQAVVMFWIYRMEPGSTREISITHNGNARTSIDSSVTSFTSKQVPRTGDKTKASGTFHFDEPMTCYGDITFQLASAPAKPESPPSEPRPDPTLKFVIKKNLSFEIVNRTSAQAMNPRYSVSMVNLDSPPNKALGTNESGTLTMLPNTTKMLEDYVPGNGTLGPYSLGNRWQEMGTLSPGDRMFGMATIGCPSCLRAHYYYVYAVHNKDGWYCETATPLTLTGVTESAIKIERSEDSLNNYCPASTRIAIKDITGSVEQL